MDFVPKFKLKRIKRQQQEAQTSNTAVDYPKIKIEEVFVFKKQLDKMVGLVKQFQK